MPNGPDGARRRPERSEKLKGLGVVRAKVMHIARTRRERSTTRDERKTRLRTRSRIYASYSSSSEESQPVQHEQNIPDARPS